MRPAAAGAILVLLLLGCAPRPTLRSGDAFGVPPERMLFAALREVAADDAQRAAILGAYDEALPKLRASNDESDAVLAQWHELDRRDPAFVQKTEALAARLGTASRERMAATAVYESRIAAALQPPQWEAWLAFWSRPQLEMRRGGGPQDEPGGGGGQRRR